MLYVLEIQDGSISGSANSCPLVPYKEQFRTANTAQKLRYSPLRSVRVGPLGEAEFRRREPVDWRRIARIVGSLLAPPYPATPRSATAASLQNINDLLDETVNLLDYVHVTRTENFRSAVGISIRA